MSCSCSKPIGNTGNVDCGDYIPGPTTSEYYMRTYADDGTLNEIDFATATLNQAYVDAKINHADPSKRWYPILNIKNFDDPREASTFKTFDDGSKFKTQKGTRAVSYVIPLASMPWFGQIEELGCQQMSKFKIDDAGAMLGKELAARVLKFIPIMMAKGTFDAIAVNAKAQDIQQVMISYDIDRREKDANIRAITPDQFDDVDLNDQPGLLDVEVVVLTCGQTSMTFELRTKFGNGLGRVLDEGLLVAELISSVGAATSKIRNTTTNADVAVTGLTEDAEGGSYTITYASQTLTNVLKVLPKRDGREYTAGSKVVS